MSVKIPKGWRKLRKGEIILSTDLWHNPVADDRGREGWNSFTTRDRTTVGQIYHHPNHFQAIHIRRAQPRRHAGKGKKKI